jgi:hypothetical protein
MVSPKSVELKQGAEETSMEEASDASSSYSGRSRGPSASIAKGVSRPELSYLATPSRRRRSLDADMATMLMSMRGAWIGEDGVQQGFPSQEGGPRLIRFEFPRWRPKAI